MNRGKANYIYRDCYCSFNKLSNPTPRCKLVTIADINQARASTDGLNSISKLNINNAFDGVPISDNIHGIASIVPAEMLHISGTGILKYKFKSVWEMIGKKNANKTEKGLFDELHHCLVLDAQCQSEQQMPRMSICNGITDGTKMCGSKRVGNYFILLCLMHTTQGTDQLA
jgi:hypothetical protein